MTTTTPQTLNIRTPYGDGEAHKATPGDPWTVLLPSGDFRWHGTKTEIKAEIRRRVVGTDEEPISFA